MPLSEPGEGKIGCAVLTTAVFIAAGVIVVALVLLVGLTVRRRLMGAPMNRREAAPQGTVNGNTN
jgi:hypothetical protein